VTVREVYVRSFSLKAGVGAEEVEEEEEGELSERASDERALERAKRKVRLQTND